MSFFLGIPPHPVYHEISFFTMSKHKSAKRALAADAVGAETKDKSAWVKQDGKLLIPLNIRNRYTLSQRQSVIFETAMSKESQVVMVDGFWGTGKSAIAVLAGLHMLNNKKCDGIVYVRNALESTSSGKVGLLPGSLEERMSPYNSVLYDKLEEFLTKPDIDRLKKDDRIECIPVSFLQGKTFTCKTVIIDEAASMSYDDLLLAVSRIGPHCKVFIIGDSTFQLTIGSRSGFKRFLDYFSDMESKENGVFVFELKEASDILRSGLIRFIMQKVGVVPRISPSSNRESDWRPLGVVP